MIESSEFSAVIFRLPDPAEGLAVVDSFYQDLKNYLESLGFRTQFGNSDRLIIDSSEETADLWIGHDCDDILDWAPDHAKLLILETDELNLSTPLKEDLKQITASIVHLNEFQEKMIALAERVCLGE